MDAKNQEIPEKNQDAANGIEGIQLNADQFKSENIDLTLEETWTDNKEAETISLDGIKLTAKEK